jgi:hypothetical protein
LKWLETSRDHEFAINITWRDVLLFSRVIAVVVECCVAQLESVAIGSLCFVPQK